MEIRRRLGLAAGMVLACLAVGARKSRAESAALKIGMADIDAKNYAQAENDLEKAVRADPRDSAAYFLLGYAYYQDGFSSGNPELADKKDAQAAVAAYQKGLTLDPRMEGAAKPYEFYFTRALCYETLGQNDEALASFKKAINAAPDNFLIPLYAARLRFLIQDEPRAKANLELSLTRAQAQGSKADLIKLIKSNVLFSSMAGDAVLGQFINQESQGDSSASDGGLHDSIGDAESSSLKLAPAPLSPEDRMVLSQVAVGEAAFQNGRFIEALRSYRSALKLDAQMEVLGSARRALIEDRMGFCHRALGLAGLAAADFKAAVSLEPFDAQAHYQLALEDAVLGRLSDSLNELEWSLKTAPTNGDVRRYSLLSRVDPDFIAVRDLPAYSALMARYTEMPQARE